MQIINISRVDGYVVCFSWPSWNSSKSGRCHGRQLRQEVRLGESRREIDFCFIRGGVDVGTPRVQRVIRTRDGGRCASRSWFRLNTMCTCGAAASSVTGVTVPRLCKFLPVPVSASTAIESNIFTFWTNQIYALKNNIIFFIWRFEKLLFAFREVPRDSVSETIRFSIEFCRGFQISEINSARTKTWNATTIGSENTMQRNCTFLLNLTHGFLCKVRKQEETIHLCISRSINFIEKPR